MVAIGFRQGSVHYFNERIDVKLESQWHDPIDLKFFMKHLNENLNENENAFKFSNAITNFKRATKIVLRGCQLIKYCIPTITRVPLSKGDSAILITKTSRLLIHSSQEKSDREYFRFDFT